MKNFLLFLLVITAIIWLYNTCSPKHSLQSLGKNSIEILSVYEIGERIDYYNGKPVIVSGIVKSSFFVGGIGSFELEDSTGSLRVMSKDQPPLQDKRVSAIVEPKLVASFNSNCIIVANQLKLLTCETLSSVTEMER